MDIAAPGVGIRSTISGCYASWQGTSMATPHVSAVAALIWSAKPSATNEQVRTALINTAEDLGLAVMISTAMEKSMLNVLLITWQLRQLVLPQRQHPLPSVRVELSTRVELKLKLAPTILPVLLTSSPT